MRNIFDSHAHYDGSQFDGDRDSLLASLPGRGVRAVMTVADSIPSSRRAAGLARGYGYVYCSAGIHPHEAKDSPDDLEAQLEAIVADCPKVRAIGETGLDYHYDFSPRERQMEIFERQLVLANRLSLPVIIHDREAHADVYALLRKHRPRGIVHCFSGSAESARELVKLGFYIGFTGMVTFPNAKKTVAAAASVPLERLLVETDCPYMAPVPLRGQRSDSSMIAYTAAALAGIKGINTQELLDATFRNACEVYGVDPVTLTSPS